jgi:phosphatidylinositol 4-phosphatase
MSLQPFRDVNVHASNSHYAFTSPSTPNAPTLVIDRPSGDIRLSDGNLLGTKRVSSIAGILGIVKLKLGQSSNLHNVVSLTPFPEDKYVIVITKAQPMGRLRGHMVYRVVATEFLPLREQRLHDPDEDKFLALLKQFVRDGPMYFSYSIDITNTFQRQAESDLSLPQWQRADDRFFWNRFIQTDLIDFRVGSGRRGQQTGADPYILPVMFGMLRIAPTRIGSAPFTFALLTRRSRHRGGARYFSRGMDEQGHVSNYNETEQVVILNDHTGEPGGFVGSSGMQTGRFGGSVGNELQIMSYVQTRGSVPVYWAEVNTLKYTPKLQIRGIDTAVEAARKHFDEQIRLYGEVYLVNLVNQKGREERVKKAYEQMVRTLVSSPNEKSESDHFSNEKTTSISAQIQRQKLDRLHYIYFDFHNETKGLKWHRAQLLLDQLSDGLVKGSYFRGLEMPGDTAGALEIRSQQTAVVRTNCMDCLDRTNVVQSMLGRWILTRQMVDAGLLKPGQNASDDPEFENLFRNMWADNADVVSNSYSGTGALKTDFTRTGNRTRAGMAQDFKSSMARYVKNNFLDGPRQDSFDLFLGAYLPPSTGAGSSLYADSRPVLLQSIPYIFAASLFIIMVSAVTRRSPDSYIWPVRLFLCLIIAVGAWSLQFIITHGMLYVNWPKLNPPPFATEGYQEALARAHKDKILGPFLTVSGGKERKARHSSMTRMGYMEEGKKRIE